MKLLLRRGQRPGMLGKIVFQLEVRADFTPEEQAAINKYQLFSAVLYQRDPNHVGEGWAEIAKALVRHAMNITVHVGDLMNGRRIECKDIMEMLAVEEQLKMAGQNLVLILKAATSFGGEEVVEL